MKEQSRGHGRLRRVHRNRPGVEGLIHVSEMSWSQHLRSAQDFMKVGDEVEAVVLTLRSRRTQDVSRHQATQGRPLGNHRRRNTPSAASTRRDCATSPTSSVFVEIEEGVDGLIHISDLSWTKKVKHPSEFTQIGADIDVQVLEIDKKTAA